MGGYKVPRVLPIPDPISCSWVTQHLGQHDEEEKNKK